MPLIWNLQYYTDVKEAKGEKPRPCGWKGNSWVKKELLEGGELEMQKNKLEISDLKEAGEAEKQSFIEGGGEIVCCVRLELAERDENN